MIDFLVLLLLFVYLKDSFVALIQALLLIYLILYHIRHSLNQLQYRFVLNYAVIQINLQNPFSRIKIHIFL